MYNILNILPEENAPDYRGNLMNDLNRLKALGISPADVLLPKEGADMTRWAVIACDQYSSEPEYWEKADEFVGESPSTLRLIIPEAFLETPKGEELQKNVGVTMDEYLSAGLFRNIEQSFVYVERSTPHAALRRGLVAAFDLEIYDFAPGNSMPIRATEGTILKRLPPRVAVRSRASLECPHVMVLIDDPAKTVIEPLSGMKAGMEKLYGFELMAGAGSVEGYRVEEDRFGGIADALQMLTARGGMLFAVGDGNHSLAAAKAFWDELKQGLTAEQRETHPARWALAELVNLHDDGLAFHAIHRVVFNAEPVELVALLLWEMNKMGWHASMGPERAGEQSIEYVCVEDRGFINISHPATPVGAGTLQQALDIVLAKLPEASVDYVHGDETAVMLGLKPGNTAFLLSAMDKAELFPAVEKLGVLPRKAFSMGEADEKRFYLECRGIK
jgi:hypothetical protein